MYICITQHNSNAQTSGLHFAPPKFFIQNVELVVPSRVSPYYVCIGKLYICNNIICLLKIFSGTRYIREHSLFGCLLSFMAILYNNIIICLYLYITLQHFLDYVAISKQLFFLLSMWFPRKPMDLALGCLLC